MADDKFSGWGKKEEQEKKQEEGGGMKGRERERKVSGEGKEEGGEQFAAGGSANSRPINYQNGTRDFPCPVEAHTHTHLQKQKQLLLNRIWRYF